MMMMTASIPNIGGSAGNGGPTVSVPPGFRFHPTDEELLYYYLRKKVAYEVIDLDVIRDVDLNKLEPWDLKDKCRIGSGPQNEWYFFSHKDKKYPTGTRTNRATNAGFWKATGRDKAIHLSTMFHANVDAAASSYSNTNKRIGMRKTLVFYTGRAPHGQKTDWIMHEYRLDEENDHHHHHLHNSDHIQVQEDGWVVCRVFKKKNHQRGFQQQHLAADHHQVVEADHEHHHHQAMQQYFNLVPHMDDDDNDEPTTKRRLLFPQQPQYGDQQHCFDGSMHLPQLLSPEKTSVACTAPPPISFPEQDISEYCSSHHQSLMKLLTSNVVGGGGSHLIQQAVESGSSRNYMYAAGLGAVGGSDWSFLDKLLSGSHQSLGQLCPTKCNPPSALMSMQVVDDDKVAADTVHETKFPIFTHHHQYLGRHFRREYKLQASSKAFLIDYKNLIMLDSIDERIHDDHIPLSSNDPTHWLPPPMGYVKINVDEACTGGRIAAGAVTRPSWQFFGLCFKSYGIWNPD